MTNEGIARLLKMNKTDTGIVWVGREAAKVLGIDFIPNVPRGDWMALSAENIVAAGGKLLLDSKAIVDKG